MKNKGLLAVNSLLIAAILGLNYVYQSHGFDFTLKCVCSGGFALLGIINLCRMVSQKSVGRAFGFSMTAGLVLAMLGDILIGYDFIIGAGTFALGHICFVVAYCLLRKIGLYDLIASGALFLGALAFLLFCPLLSFEVAAFRVVCIVYALIISLMLGKAVGNFLQERNLLYGVLAAGSLLFFFSDLMLVFDWFIGLWDWTSHACMGTYYPALCLLAFSIYLKGAQNR